MKKLVLLLLVFISVCCYGQKPGTDLTNFNTSKSDKMMRDLTLINRQYEAGQNLVIFSLATTTIGVGMSVAAGYEVMTTYNVVVGLVLYVAGRILQYDAYTQYKRLQVHGGGVKLMLF